ncbi:MAG TPA: hypothetical protein DDW52_25505, partial [Planctomycetaceae bacterium]|nr:hypothetical protein [Planctomycetaceae bacterium]
MCFWGLAALMLLSFTTAPALRAAAWAGQEPETGQAVSDSEDDAEEQAESSETTDEAPAAGLDKMIDDAFAPVATWWEGFVLTPVPVAGTDIPFVLILLVAGASFFTLAFVFPNIRLFPFAIRVVSGKYDEVEKAGAAAITKREVNEADGDLVDTIRDEAEEGEVSHFQ